MEFIIAQNEHIDRMCEITEDAKKQLHGLGLDQWQKGYPSREVWEQDVINACTYLAVEDGVIQGIFAFQTTPDPIIQLPNRTQHARIPLRHRRTGNE